MTGKARGKEEDELEIQVFGLVFLIRLLKKLL